MIVGGRLLQIFVVVVTFPPQCREPITGNEWPNGCEQQVCMQIMMMLMMIDVVGDDD